LQIFCEFPTCNLFASVAICSEQSAHQNCNITGQYCNVARKRTSGLTVIYDLNLLIWWFDSSTSDKLKSLWPYGQKAVNFDEHLKTFYEAFRVEFYIRDIRYSFLAETSNRKRQETTWLHPSGCVCRIFLRFSTREKVFHVSHFPQAFYIYFVELSRVIIVYFCWYTFSL
jgi:hypothetical protein